MRLMLILTLCVLCFTAACRNAPAEAREELRYDVQAVRPDERDGLRAKLADALMRESDPHLRAAAAQGLGNLRDPADFEVLLEALAGPPAEGATGARISSLADPSPQVRMEAAIALGKLRFDSAADPRRATVIAVLRSRIAFDRDPAGRLLETQFSVRSAMLNSLIALGGRGGAAAIHDVATRLLGDLATGTATLTAATDKGLLDHCFQGLSMITGVPASQAASHRVESDDLREHLDWWARRISEMRDS
jgi:hypothetical protein